MNPMIEAAARAMAGAQWDIDRKAGLVQLMTREEWMDEYWPKIAALLPAALRAMMELKPTDDMREEVYAWIRTAMDVDELWRALLGAIIGEVE